MLVAEAGLDFVFETDIFANPFCVSPLLGSPAIVLADKAAASLADPGHSLPSLLPPPAAVGSLPQRATLVGLITRRSLQIFFIIKENTTQMGGVFFGTSHRKRYLVFI